MILIGDLFLILGVLLLILAFLALFLREGDRLATASHERLKVATLGALGLTLGLILRSPEWGDRPLVMLLLVLLASAVGWPVIGSSLAGNSD